MVTVKMANSCDICLLDKAGLRRFGLLFICTACHTAMRPTPDLIGESLEIED